MPSPNAFTNVFAGNPLDRGGDGRSDPAWLEAKLSQPDAIAVALWNGRVLLEAAPDGGERLAYLRGPMAREAVRDVAERMLWLGSFGDTPVFAVEFEGEADPTAGLLAGLGRFEEMRPLALLVPGPEAGIAATAKSLFDWRRRHRFCSACGQPSEIRDGGWKRSCPACGTDHFPRTDPVTIMLAVHGDRCLMGRQHAWPAGRMSALAGFLEPGETIEEACARELKEEAGLTATRVVYHSSQPWPFPSTLMIGLIAEVEDDHAVPDDSELEEVRWFTRDQIRTLVETGEYEDVRAPFSYAIAFQLLKAWAEGFGPG